MSNRIKILLNKGIENDGNFILLGSKKNNILEKLGVPEFSYEDKITYTIYRRSSYLTFI